MVLSDPDRGWVASPMSITAGSTLPDAIIHLTVCDGECATLLSGGAFAWQDYRERIHSPAITYTKRIPSAMPMSAAIVPRS